MDWVSRSSVGLRSRYAVLCLRFTVPRLSVVVMTTAGHVTRQPIGVLEHGLDNRRLRLTG